MMRMGEHIIGSQRDLSRCVCIKDRRSSISSLILQLLPLLLLLLILIPLSFSCAGLDTTDWSGVTIRGKLADEGGNPVEGAHVYAYSQGKSNTLGPAEGMSEPTGADGAYILVLPEGIYTLVARRRMSGSISGPLRNGDMSGQMSKPMLAGPGDRTGVNITLTVFRQGSDGDPKRILNTHTRIKGIVTDPGGNVLGGTHVFAYRGDFRSDPPDILSPATGPDGQFEISLPGSGFYTIGARTGLRGKPLPEDSIGFWGGKDQQWDIKGGSVTDGVRIIIYPYQGIGQEE